MREQDGGAPRRDRDGVAPRSGWSAGQRGTGDPRTMGLAAYFYKKVADTWNAQEFAQFQFPRIVKEDWPTIYKIKYDMADLLYFQQRWNDCGPRSTPSSPRTRKRRKRPKRLTPRCSATRTSTSRRTRTAPTRRAAETSRPGPRRRSPRPNDDRLAAKQFTDTQKGMISAFNRYICYIHPAASDTQGQDQLVEVRFARARTYFEAQHWEEVGGRVPRDRHGERRQGRRHLRRAALSRERQRPWRALEPSTSVVLRRHGERRSQVHRAVLHRRQVREEPGAVHEAHEIQCDIQRIKAEKLVQLANKTGGSAALQPSSRQATRTIELLRKSAKSSSARTSRRRATSSTRLSTTRRRRTRRPDSSRKRFARA